MSDLAVAVLVNLTVKPEMTAEFESELRQVLTLVRAEPACLAIHGHQDPDDPTRFMLFERWRSRAEFTEFESGREYLRAYMDRVRPWWSRPRELRVWDQIA